MTGSVSEEKFSAYHEALKAVELVFSMHGQGPGSEVAKEIAAQTALAVLRRTTALDMSTDLESYEHLVAARLRILPEDSAQAARLREERASIVPSKNRPDPLDVYYQFN